MSYPSLEEGIGNHRSVSSDLLVLWVIYTAAADTDADVSPWYDTAMIPTPILHKKSSFVPKTSLTHF